MTSCRGSDALTITNGVLTNIASDITCIKLPNTVTSIRSGDSEDFAFQRSSTTLTEIDFSISTEITTIGSYAFYHCTEVKRFDLSRLTKLTTLGEHAFRCCTSSKEFILPTQSKLTVLPGGCFAECTSSPSIKIPSTIETFASIDNEYGAFVDSGFEVILFDDDSRLKTITGKTFTYCLFKNITLPKTIISIGGYSFRLCPKLEKIFVK